MGDESKKQTTGWFGEQVTDCPGPEEMVSFGFDFTSEVHGMFDTFFSYNDSYQESRDNQEWKRQHADALSKKAEEIRRKKGKDQISDEDWDEAFEELQVEL